MAKEQTPAELPGAFSLFKPSMDVLLRNIGTLLILFAIVMGLSILGSANGKEAGLFELLSSIVQILLAPAVIYTLLRSAEDKDVRLEEAIRKGVPFVLRYFFLQILTVLLVLLGMVFFLVPGLFAFQRLYLAPYYLIDRNVGIIEAMKLSAADAKKYSAAVWGLLGVIVAIVLLMVTIILIPVSIALLVAYLGAPAVRYVQMRQANKPAKVKKAR